MTKTLGANKRELHTGEFNDIVHTCNINDITCEEGNIMIDKGLTSVIGLASRLSSGGMPSDNVKPTIIRYEQATPTDEDKARLMNEVVAGVSPPNEEVPTPKVKLDYSKIYYSNEVVPEEFGEYNFNDPTKYNKDSDSYVAYLDTKGKLTLGAGILVNENFFKTTGKKKLKVGDTVPKDIVESVGLTRWKNSIKESRELLPNLSEDQVLPLAEMIYQMGKPSVSKFENTLKLYREGKFKEAADEALNSNWAKKDTPNRAKRVAEKIKNLAPKTKKQIGSIVERNPYANYQPKAI
jgi:GH24 family phage-related lysozyme (muramidase)